MIGDPSWMDDLEYGYAQHLADCQRLERSSKSFDEYAIDRTWKRFVITARYALTIPEFAITDWATTPPVRDGGYRSTVLARRAISALVMVMQLLKDMSAEDRALATSLGIYLRKGGGEGAWAPRAKRFVYDWLYARAKIEAPP